MFDARSEETVIATISFISPIAIEIDGVAYFEATLTFPEAPGWLRSGLNADVDIIIGRQSDVLRVPKRFVTEAESGTFVTTFADTERKLTQQTDVSIIFTGNDGFLSNHWYC